MQFFLDFIKEFKEVEETINQISLIKGHQGTSIGFSDDYLLLYELRKQNRDYLFRDLYYTLFRGRYYNRLASFLYSIFKIDVQLPSPFTFSDFEKMQKEMEEIRTEFRISPIEITISIFNDARREYFEEIVRNIQNESTATVYTFRIERRGQNTALSTRKIHHPLVGGISIGNQNEKVFGTLGGILKDGESNRYGLTCSHVASEHITQTNYSAALPIYQPAKYDSKRARVIGNVLTKSTIQVNNDDSCNNEIRNKNIDVALIKIDPSEDCQSAIDSLGTISRVMPFNEMNQLMKVEFNGRSTNKRRELFVGHLNVSYKIAFQIDGQTQMACFTNLIELRSQPIQWPWRWNLSKKPMLKGDSGAWICSSESQGYAWCGMIISGDVDRGYILSATRIMDWLREKGYELTTL